MHTPTHAAFPILDCIPNWLACSWKLCLSRRSWTCTYIVRQQKWFGVEVPVGNSQTHGFNVSFYSCSYPYGGFPNKTIGFNKMSRSNFGWFEGTTILGKGCRIVFGFFFFTVLDSFFGFVPLQFFHGFLQFFHGFLQFFPGFLQFFHGFPWFSAIFPWFSSMFPWFYSIFHGFLQVFYGFLQSINQYIYIYIYVCMYVCVYVCMYVGR